MEDQTMLSQLVETVPVPFAALDADGVFYIWNGRMERLCGLSSSDVNGRSYQSFSPGMSNLVARVRQGGNEAASPLFDIFPETSSLTAFPMDVCPLMLKAVPLGENANAGIALVVGCSADVFHGYDDIFNFVQSLSRDELLYERVSERIEERQQKILQSEKLAGIGHLAAGVAHEINNPVGYIYSNLNAMRDYVGDVVYLMDAFDKLAEMVDADSDVGRYIDSVKRRTDMDFLKNDMHGVVAECIDGVERVKQIVQSLKDFSHIDDNEFAEYNLIDGIEATLKVANNELKYKADLVREFGPPENIECLPSQINQVILNLLVNSAQAMKERGTITLRTGGDNRGVWFEVEDTGSGISEDNLNRLFEPFFTTKPVGQGTGLGLSLSYSIVKKHGGDIKVRSRVGEGTAFRVWLPRRQQSVEQIA